MKSVSGKIKGLEDLIEQDNGIYFVPEYDVIDVSLYESIEKQALAARLASALSSIHHIPSKLPKKVKQRVNELFEKYQSGDIIVRSSSLMEDGEHSFAGIYNSIIIKNVTREELYDAVMKIYSSINSKKAQEYRAKHGILDDQMEIIIQRFVEPDFSGVMYTSNPSYPNDLSIEFCHGRNTVVDGGEASIVDFAKESGERVFISEDMKRDDDPFNLNKLFEIGKYIDGKFGASDVEFAIKDNKFYLVQKRIITDLSEPVQVDIPEYDKGQFIGRTNLMRGKGKITLPAVVVNYELTDVKIDILALIDPDEAKRQLKLYFDTIINSDKEYKEGYCLVIPHFNETVAGIWGRLPFIGYETTTDKLTPNKKAVITTKSGQRSSHIMTVAREKGIAYAGFMNREDILNSIITGDMVSLYFKDREAFVYKEKSAPKSLREKFPQAKVIVENIVYGTRFEVDWSIGSYKHISTDLGLFLNSQNDQKWTYEPTEGLMGGVFTNQDNESFELSIGKVMGKCYSWNLSCARDYMADKPISKNKLKQIVDLYVKYLQD